MSNISDAKLEEADAIDAHARDMLQQSLRLRNEVLAGRGWDVTKELIGGSYTYFYRKGNTLHICEHEALADD